MIRRRVHDEDDLLPAESQNLDVVEAREPEDEGGSDRQGSSEDPQQDADRVPALDVDVDVGDGDVGDGEHRDDGEAEDSGADSEVGERELDEDLGSEVAEAEIDDGKLAAVPDFPKDPNPTDLARLRRLLEAVLFASTEGLTPSRLAEVLRVSLVHVKSELETLADELEAEGRPYALRPHGGAWRLYTREEFYPYLLRLKSLKKVEKLTPAALETLAIVAYRQPVIRAEIEAIRGVRSGPLLRALLDRKLIRVLGRAEVPGAPLQYGTTQRFLDRFGLATLKDLPSLKEFRQGRI